MSSEALLGLIVAASLFAFIPGPAMLYAAARTMADGRKGGLMAVLGIHIGAYVHIAAASAGLSALFHAVPPAYIVVKLAGAAYLLWLGIALFRRTSVQAGEMVGASKRSPARAFLQSIVVEVLNPKTVIFFTAFLPQFIPGSGDVPVWVQLLLLGMLVNGIFTIADIASVLLADVIMDRLRQSGAVQTLVQRMGGALLIELGTHLALERN
jgi:threonine/homoserine/homoserine lactone efflux protein